MVDFRGEPSCVIHVGGFQNSDRRRRNIRLIWLGSMLVLGFMFLVQIDWFSMSSGYSTDSLALSSTSEQKPRAGILSDKVRLALFEAGNGEEDCNEACKYIKYRMQRAWEVGTILFDSCRSMGLEGCGNSATSTQLCECEKKAAETMCVELEYAWTELCPKTSAPSLERTVCSGQMMTDSKLMCKNLEVLPGVLVNYWPLGIEGLSKIDDFYVPITKESESSESSESSAPVESHTPAASSQQSPPPAASAAPPEEEGGDEGGVASGMDASD